MAEHGGKREGSGRPTKAEEEKVKNLATKALSKIFGSEKKAFEHIASMCKGKDGFNYLKLMLAYAYGQPKEKVSVDVSSIDVTVG